MRSLRKPRQLTEPLAGGRRHLVAIDLGSNSFHLLLARQQDGGIEIVNRFRDPVRLGGGIDREGYFTPEAMERALRSIELMATRIRNLQGEHLVRAVGTHALRTAKNSGSFVEQAQKLLGHPIRILSGDEEARLIFSGVTSVLPASDEERLVVDIGGGSTEFILGRHGQPRFAESVAIGCVGITREFFSESRATTAAMQAAQSEIGKHLKGMVAPFLRNGWKASLGTSGIVRTICRLCRQAQAGDARYSIAPGMTLDGLRQLERQLVAREHFPDFTEFGISVDRAQVLCGGLCILLSVFEIFEIDRMEYVDATLLEGVLHELYEECAALP